MDANRAAFERWRIVPRVLRDVEKRDLSIELFGRRLPSPLLLSPIGVLEIVHRDADLAVGRAAALGAPFIFSNQASVPMEQVAAAMGDAPHWFQLYWSRSNELVASFVKRAEALALGATAVCLGRPYVYGLALAGQPGVQEVIGNVLAEFDLTLGLAGCASVPQVGKGSLVAGPAVT